MFSSSLFASSPFCFSSKVSIELFYSYDENGILKEDLVLEEEGSTWDVVGNTTGDNELTRVTKHKSRLATAVPN